jgi:hypothetical protein
MMTCRQVSTLLATGDLARAPLSRRLAVRLHLAMCRHCSAFKRWLDVVVAAGREASSLAEREAPADLESRTLRRIDPSTL